ncbi:MAG: hypothetical protein UU73_C0004G0021 [Candidatus Daviesbacteria bacterium GW2011_GWA1_41_61]|nr:MAG: hypothetical protein UU26_C0011G0014 [Candidatus Daviesbacteria bacterium GW2011_GWC1_40_9]KKR93225.1 MAG: hypothetical protein UU44_C0003G0021 [Candidatus Daviesbacteria bacterium GW2011_GWB1_41_15]KKS14713.1 MAG: hypothetical protein UU73_C0004G0021 [Candidatus Daviesbacteria bacterium GW2011_GWA1_41_61]
MDILQLSLVFLISLIAILLAFLGTQFFYVLKDLRVSLQKLNKILDSTGSITENIQKPVEAAANLTSAVEAGVKAVKMGIEGSEQVKKLFNRDHKEFKSK